jgi:UDP-glucose/GDP-mannose dehydrogenase family, NAD binding domain
MLTRSWGCRTAWCRSSSRANELVETNLRAGRLAFATKLNESVRIADAVFIAVGTPARRGDGHADLAHVYAAAREIAVELSAFTVIVTKSTVPVGTGDEVERIVRQVRSDADIAVVSNPEFLREGNFSRVETTNVCCRQMSRRSMVNFAGIVVRADSPVQVPQQFANVQIGVPFYSGTHYLCLQMLEGFVRRELIKIGRVPNGSNYRFKMLMDKMIEATTLTEPYISLAEKMGLSCRHLGVSPRHHAASDRVDAETYAAFNRAIREAVRRIMANKRAYLHYFIDYYRDRDRLISQLTIDDLRESRLYLVDPAPIPADELQRTYDWMKSWDFLETSPCATDLVNMDA